MPPLTFLITGHLTHACWDLSLGFFQSASQVHYLNVFDVFSLKGFVKQ